MKNNYGNADMDIKKVACVGAGLIGSGWATLFLTKGYKLKLHDINENILNNAIGVIRENLLFQEKNKFLKAGETRKVLKLIDITTNIETAVFDADYIQESVLDDLDLKHRVFREIDAATQDHTIIASSASGLLMKDIQKATISPERCVMVHPILPVHLIPLVEIGGGPDTSPAAIKITENFMKKLGKTAVVLKKEVPGYIVNRLQAAILREAMDLVDKGVATAEDIDKAFCKGCGLRDPFIGPFLRAHLAGNNIENFFEHFGQSYRYRLESMETWTCFPSSAVDSVVKDVNNMKMVVENSIEELKTWRNDKLVKLLKIAGNP
jgi:3-hydroxypropionate dehydrogenase (NADP+)